MKWFKHMANARDDDFIEWLEENYGFEGYGRWWRILEIIAASMDKNSNDPSATHTLKKWQELLSGKWSILNSFLLAIQLKGKLRLEQNENILKISCDNILKMRDNHTRNLQAACKPLTSDLALEAELDKDKERNSLTLFSAHSVDNSLPIPVPKLPEERKKVLNGNDYDAAAAAAAILLGRRLLTPSDATLLGAWLKAYHFEQQIWPLLKDKTQKFAEKNMGKRPGSLQYFEDAVKEIR